MSLKERDRLVILRQMAERTLTVAEGARRLRMGLRHARRLLRRFEEEGDGGVIHRGRGRPSNRRLPDPLRARALECARQPVFRDFGPTLLTEHLARDPQMGPLSASTLRRWLIQAELWKPQPRQLRHRRRRDRRAAWGELVLMDTSIHPWLEDRSTEEIVLIAMIDDATSRVFARFVPRDTGAANRQMILDYIARFGRMAALYADRASHFGNWRRTDERSRVPLEEREATLTESIIRRGLETLGSELIIALSPQAKGRVERLFGTLQDRLVKELRVAGVRSLEAANRFLEEVFVPFWNARFTVEPMSGSDAHQPVPSEIDLLARFAETDTRVIGLDFTFRYRNQRWQIEKREACATMPKQRIVIEHRLDGSTHYRWRDHYLSPTAVAPTPSTPTAPKPKSVPPPPRPLPPEHPWRRFPVRIGRGVHLPPHPTPVVASAPAALRPDSPGAEEVLCIST